MKNIILLLALVFFTFSATSLMAQTPKVTSVEMTEVSARATTNTARRTCGTKSNKPMNGKQVKGQVVSKAHGKHKVKCGTKIGHGKHKVKCGTKIGHGKAVHNKANVGKKLYKHSSKTCCKKGKGKSVYQKTGKKQAKGFEVRNSSNK